MGTRGAARCHLQLEVIQIKLKLLILNNVHVGVYCLDVRDIFLTFPL